ncbi:MAG: alpha/beta fold hydrolase [Acidobacteriota bacterium]|nr:alpha/beta fold hydrolase [Acidobacteriota bacterium]
MFVSTPDECFASLPGYPFKPRWVDVGGGLRMHYVADGPDDGPIVLLLHGYPTWSYVYRKVIPVLADAGLRPVAPDLVGFGRSDKLTERTAYSFESYVDWLGRFIDAVDLRDITLVAQDWGGPIGLATLSRRPERFSRVVLTNTILHTCEPDLEGRTAWAHHRIGGGRVVLSESLLDYVAFTQRAPEIKPSLIVGAVAGPIAPEVAAAYDAPFPEPVYTAALRQLPALIPLTGNDPGAAIGRATWSTLAAWTKPLLTAYSDGDPATAGWDHVFQQRVPGAAGRDHVTIAGAGHFVQEQKGDELGRLVAAFVVGTSSDRP